MNIHTIEQEALNLPIEDRAEACRESAFKLGCPRGRIDIVAFAQFRWYTNRQNVRRNAERRARPG